VGSQGETNWRSELNDAQRRAVEYAKGPLIVLAGPGTGKTRVITSRLRRLIEEGAEPESLLALTFSVKAAEEMRTRLAAAVGERIAERVQASTFHSFGYRLLQRFGDLVGLRSERTIMDSAQTRRLLRGLIGEHRLLADLTPKGAEAAIVVARRFIERLRQAARSSGDAIAWAERWGRELESSRDESAEGAAERFRHRLFADCSRLMRLYEEACLERGWVSFDDCLGLPLRIFREKPVVAAIVRQEVRHIVVDEFQDVDRGQIELLRSIAPPLDDAGRGPDLCVVGDDDQAIYGFRGSDTHSFTRFSEIWAEAHTIPLTVNYRSQRAIVGAANQHIARSGERFAPDKMIEPAPGAGPGVLEGVILDDDAQAAGAIGALIQRDRAENPERSFSSYAVLASKNAVVESIAESLAIAGFPVSLRRAATPLEDAGVQDLLAWVSLLAEPGGPGSAANVQRLLTRPPFLVAPATVSAWGQEYRRRAALARMEAGESAAPSGGDATFLGWLTTGHSSDGAVRRLGQMFSEFQREALTAPADVVLERIIREAGLTDAEDLTGRSRAARVAHLILALRFARSRQPFLDPPGDIGAFWRYYNDLDEKEQQFVTPSFDRLEVDPDDAPSDNSTGGAGAIQVLTAHKSKGLEFDTVFLAQCRPGGFPGRRQEREEAADFIPEDFLDQRADDRSDEQRRLFYVACTRAERRLVMLAKRKKSKGVTDYFIELTEESPGVEVLIREVKDLLEAAGAEGLSAAEFAVDDDLPTRRRRDTLIDRAARDARQRAYSALHDAAAVGAGAEDMEAIARRLREAAIELRALEGLRTHQTLAEELPEAVAQRLRPVALRAAEDLGPERLIKPVAGPLSLSYSMITDYQRCPLCCYVKYVMGLDERKSTELSTGNIAHKALQWFYEEWRNADSEGRLPPGWERLVALGRKACRDEWPAGADFDAGAVATVEALLRNCFEKLHDPSANILHIESSVRFLYPDARDPSMLHRFVAKIDRIDQLPTGEIRIVDYKSGVASQKLIEPKTDDLQMCIYAMALGALMGEQDAESSTTIRSAEHIHIPGRAEYWLLQDGVRGVIGLQELSLTKARKEIDKVIEGFLEGRFPRGGERTCKGLCTLLPSDIEEA
jgi:DNA helicase-2/ATP-dependent DNA helicase PcrA